MRENPSEPFTVGEGIWEVMAKWLSSEQEAGSTAHPSDLGTLPQHGVIFTLLLHRSSLPAPCYWERGT